MNLGNLKNQINHCLFAYNQNLYRINPETIFMFKLKMRNLSWVFSRVYQVENKINEMMDT